MQPAGEVSRAAGDDGVLGQPLGEPAHDFAVLHLAGHRPRLGPLQELLAPGSRAFSPRWVGKLYALQRMDELRHPRIDGERWPVYAAELLSSGMHVHERLLRHRRHDERVAARRHLAKPRADYKQHVGLLHALGELRIDADADVADIVLAA